MPEAICAVEAEQAFKNLDTALQEMPRQMLTFSKSMKSRYVENALETGSKAASKYQTLRNGTKNDAMVYFKGILPVSEMVISAIDGLFEYFMQLGYDELRWQLSGMLEEFRNCRELCEMIKTMHEKIMVPLKRREDEAKEVMMELRELQQEYERKKAVLEKNAATKNKWAIGLMFVPGINLIVSPALMFSAKSDKRDAVLQGVQAQTQGAAAMAVSDTLIPALTGFIEGLGCAAGFFAEMENEIIKCQGRADRSDREGMPQTLYKMMRSNAENIRIKCHAYMKALPDVRTDFEAICTEGTNTEIDPQYVYNSLRELLKMFKALRKPRPEMTAHLKREIQHQRGLACPNQYKITWNTEV